MSVETTDRDITTLIDNIGKGEILLPEIQRGYVWKPTQVAKLIDSLYRGYPSGAFLLWQTDHRPLTHDMAIETGQGATAVPPLYLLDGQQRLTALYRVFDDDPQAQIVFNVQTEAFQNQSAATRKDPRWIKVHDVVRASKIFSFIGKVSEANPALDQDTIGERINRLFNIRTHMFHMEILSGFGYDEVTEIFVRVNSGGRSLRISDLALATLSARWPGVLGKLETESKHWAKNGYRDIDITFLTRALTGAVLGRGLSNWSYARLTAANEAELEHGWTTVQRGLRRLVPLLRNNLKITHSRLLPSVIVLLPLIVLLGDMPDEPLADETRDGILYWFLVATIHNRYSGATDTKLGQDIPAARDEQPVRRLLGNLGIVGTPVEVTSQALAGRGSGSPYFFLSFLAAKDAGAHDWWDGVEITGESDDGRRLDYHHIHPQATLRKAPNDYTKTEINDLANLAFISAKANQKISARPPRDYFPELSEAELTAHFVPLDAELRSAETYRGFLIERRRLLAATMTELLNRYRPAWLDQKTATSDELAGSTLEFTLYRNGRDADRLVARAYHARVGWAATIDFAELENVIEAARGGIPGDLDVGGENVPVRTTNDGIELPVGPFQVIGTAREWGEVLSQEQDDARPLSECPRVAPALPLDVRVPFPVTSID